MAVEEVVTSVTRVAGADLSAAQYTFVKLNASGQVVQCNAQGEQPYGVLQNDPGLGEAATVAIAGLTKLEAGEAVTAGNLVGTAADGQALDGTLAIGNIFAAYALSSAAAAGEIITADLGRYLGTHP